MLTVNHNSYVVFAFTEHYYFHILKCHMRFYTAIGSRNINGISPLNLNVLRLVKSHFGLLR